MAEKGHTGHRWQHDGVAHEIAALESKQIFYTLEAFCEALERGCTVAEGAPASPDQ